MNDYERIADLIEQGRKIEAIKLLRESTGIGLAEAKAQIEQLSAEAAEHAMPAERPGLDTPGLPEDVLALARGGRKIEAIKLLREQSGLGLKEAKERIEAEVDTTGASVTNPRALVIAVAIAVLLLGMAMALFVMAS
jgi:ribosomal protein L7/L12